ncbi:HEAT repeat domain-containing protein [Streptomyces sp. NPDC059008]|uniref:HEAT repeat domain-containing protein n=1 Tax=Streptomyces sp. NPDC059008 TaxID=3346693 RepID=UPI00367A3A02
MKPFDSYHWRGMQLTDASLESARQELAESSEIDTTLQSFTQLLHSEDSAAIGIALDHYHYAVSQQRYGIPNPYSDYTLEVLERARELLKQPPTHSTFTGPDIEGSNHSSALLIMMNHAKPEDSGLILRVLENSANSDVASGALAAAGRILDAECAPDDALIHALAGIALDESKDPDERLDAVRALARSSASQALSIMERIADLETLDLQVTAVHALGFHAMDRYRPLVEQRSASWPDDLPYPAFDVQRLLREHDSKGNA